MPVRLRQEEVVTIGVLAEKGQGRCEIARTLGVSEGTVRHHLKRAAAGAADGRSEKPFRAEAMSGQIRAWIEERQSLKRPINVRELYGDLVHKWECEGSCRSVLRCVRRRWPRPKMRTWRRVEAPAGAQSQTDWGESPEVEVEVEVGDGPHRRRGGIPAHEPTGGQPVFPAGRRPLPEGGDDDRHQQVGQGLARDPGRRRGDDHGPAGPAAAPLPRVEHQRKELPAQRLGADVGRRKMSAPSGEARFRSPCGLPPPGLPAIPQSSAKQQGGS